MRTEKGIVLATTSEKSLEERSLQAWWLQMATFVEWIADLDGIQYKLNIHIAKVKTHEVVGVDTVEGGGEVVADCN